jgi:hypothetical protein
LRSVEKLKGETLAHIFSRPFVFSHSAGLERAISVLKRANTLAEVERAENHLLKRVRDDHQAAFSSGLLEACRRASVALGFSQIDCLPGDNPYFARFAASDNRGRTLVFDVRTPIDGKARIETEVVGVNDGSCHDILDSLSLALEAEGVEAHPTRRKSTGGVADLAAAKDFLVRRLPARAHPSGTDHAADSTDAVRRQRLNQKRTLTRQS